RAVQDLDDICEYIARSSQEYARMFAQQVMALAESIPAQPRLGGVVPEYDQEDVRERLLHSYRIIYRLRGDDVEVVSIVHGARRRPADRGGRPGRGRPAGRGDGAERPPVRLRRPGRRHARRGRRHRRAPPPPPRPGEARGGPADVTPSLEKIGRRETDMRAARP